MEKIKSKISGEIKDAFLCKEIGEVKISLLDKDKNILKTIHSLKDGTWSIYITDDVKSLRFDKEGFVSKERMITPDFPSIIRMLQNNLIGYQDKLWYSPGDLVTAYIHSPKEYNVRLIKHGLKNQQIENLGTFPAIYQDIPDEFFVVNGLNWEKAVEYKIPEKADSGLYSLELVQVDGIQYNISFVLEPKIQHKTKDKRILVLASTNNWQTYNIWGGRSRYRNFENPSSKKLTKKLFVMGIRFVPEKIKSLIKNSLKGKVVVTIKDHPNASQFRRLSIRRPHPNCSVNGKSVGEAFTSHLAEGEWRILSWLEREGYEFDLISGYQLHTNPQVLRNYDLFILSTHCEYWSKIMFNGLKKFFNDGGSILNLSGNSIYREVEFYNDGSLHCTSLRFTDSVEDESQLIGVRFDMRGYGSCAPFKTLDSSHWVFEGTGLRNGDLFADKSLNHFSGNSNKDFNSDPASQPGMAPLIGNGGSGWETDKITKTSPPDIKLLAKGMNKRRGGADMIIREPENKGIMFSASSITFGGSLLIDEVSSKIVNNVIKKSLSNKK